MNAKLVTKSVEATIEPIPDTTATDPNGEFEVILATPGTDREGDDLQASGWQQPLPEHITFDTDHGMSVRSLAGSGTPTLERDGSIRVKGSYAGTEHGQTTRQLVNEKHIRTVSVTYLQRTTKAAGGGKATVVRELLNGSFVAVPANPRARVLTSKSLGAADGELADSIEVRFHADDIAAIAEATAKSWAESQSQTDLDNGSTLTIVSKSLTGKIAGSVEDLGDRVRKAVRDKHRNERGYPWVRATFLDDSTKGTVVYELESYGENAGPSTNKTLARDFTIDGTKVTLDDTAREVSLVTSVVDDEPADAVAKGLNDPVERAVELLVGNGMTREAATKALGVVHTGATLASSEQAASVPPAAGAAATKAAAPAAQDETAAAPLDMRARALILQLDDAAD